MSIPIPSRQLFIDGEWREPVNRKRLSVINPSTEEVIGDIPSATSEDVELAVDAARGAVSSARIATYKVCGADGCPNDANLVGFDDANIDGVYIISVPLGDKYPVPFDQDPVAISSFHTLKKGMVDLKFCRKSKYAWVLLENFDIHLTESKMVYGDFQCYTKVWRYRGVDGMEPYYV